MTKTSNTPTLNPTTPSAITTGPTSPHDDATYDSKPLQLSPDTTAIGGHDATERAQVRGGQGGGL